MLRNIFLIILLGVLHVILWLIYIKIDALPMLDFVEYWASGRINLSGGNPYDASQILAMEKYVGWPNSEALMMFNPPWTLPYAMFFGLMEYPFARFLVFLIQLMVVCFCALQLWRIFHGEKRKEWISVFVILTFAPTLHVLKAGQITVLALLGTVGFIFFLNKNNDFWAGAFASLALVKPHLLYIFVIAILLWSLEHHRLRIILGMATIVLLQTAIALIANPHSITQYINILQLNPMNEWITSTLGGYLRILLGPDKSVLQYLPSFIGLVWFILFWAKYHAFFNWITYLPLMILVSLATAAYGWTFDATITIWGIIQVVILFDFHRWTIAKALIMFAYWALNLFIAFANVSQDMLWWFPSVFLILYLFSMYYLNHHQATPINTITAQTAQ